MAVASFIYKCGKVVALALIISIRCNAQNTDIRWLRDINVHRNVSLDGAMKVVTNSTYPVTGAIPLTELIVGYVKHDTATIRNGWATAAGLCVTGVIAYGLKYGINRTAPYITYPDLQPYQRDGDPSFPSGHATFAFYSATSLSLCYPKWYVIAPSYLWATVVGYSRLDLGVHYPSDVLAGAVLGTATGLLAYKGNKWLLHRRHEKEKMIN